jgi:hypothetical protein
MKTFDIITEPKDETYRKLILHSLNYCDSFFLIIRPTVSVKETVHKIINELQPYLIEKSAKSELPGIKLHNDSALVYKFHLNKETTNYLIKVASKLYSWQLPDLPEDLCLLGKNGEPWLTTISYESDSYLVITEDEKKEILKEIPGLVLEEKIKIVN